LAIRCVVLDFDGTFTDVEAEAVDFEPTFQAELASWLGQDVTREWLEAKAELQAHPGLHGWVNGGVVVAPAQADPYIRTTTTAQRVLDRLGALTDSAARSQVMQGFYRTAYQRTTTAFRPEAREVLDELLGTGLPITFVTNAVPDVVERKLAALNPRGRERLGLIGEAQKFVLGLPSAPDARFLGLPETAHLPGLPRPVYLRRGPYYEALRALWQRTGTSPEETLLCGDIYELDLCMPAALGVFVHLIAGPGVAPWEKVALQQLGPRGGISLDLRALPERAKAGETVPG